MEEMAATAREDGASGQERGQRGCEHYDRGCLLKVTPSMGSSPISFLWAGLGRTGQPVRLGFKFEVNLLFRIPFPPGIGFLLRRTFLARR